MIAIDPASLRLKESQVDFNQRFLFRLASKLMSDSAKNWPLFFLSKPDNEVMLGWGSIHEVSAKGPGRIDYIKKETKFFESKLNSKEKLPPWLGGFSFFEQDLPEKKDDIWKSLPASIFFLPKYFFLLKNNRLTFQAFGQKNERKTFETLLEEVEKICFEPPGVEDKLIWQEQPGDETQQAWKNSFERLSPMFRSGALNKVVLSRKKTYRASQSVTFDRIWNRFSSIDRGHTYQFAFLWKDNLFLGSTPEILFSMNEQSVTVPAIAGTRPRGKNPKEDAMLAQNLIDSRKEREEHKFVTDYIREKLDALGQVLVPAAPVVLKLPLLQHLFTNHILHPQTSVHALDLLKSLHPTPAMAGVPKLDALNFIQNQEPYQRGYFAAPIGYMYNNVKDSCFVVAIRSALVQPREFHVFAGAGVVQASNAEQEWLETENKMKTMIQVLAS